MKKYSKLEPLEDAPDVYKIPKQGNGEKQKFLFGNDLVVSADGLRVLRSNFQGKDNSTIAEELGLGSENSIKRIKETLIKDNTDYSGEYPSILKLQLKALKKEVLNPYVEHELRRRS